MLETRAATGRAASVAAVGAELGRGVAALARQRRVGENFAQGIPGTDIAHRVGARGLADGRLVHEHDFAQLFGAEQAIKGTRGFGGLAEVAHQGRGQHVLDQGGFAGAGDAGDADQAPKRDLDRDILEVVLAHPFQNEARRVVRDHAPKAHADLFAPAQVGAGQRVGVAQLFGRAVEHDLSTALARAGTHVDHAVGRKHDGRVVLHHHQRVAGVAQALHGFDDAVDVARVQTDAGLVQHEQGVDQRGTQSRGQVDALHFAARQGAALAVQRQVADADIAQVFEAGSDFFVEKFQRLPLALIRSFPRWRKVGMGAGGV